MPTNESNLPPGIIQVSTKAGRRTWINLAMARTIEECFPVGDKADNADCYKVTFSDEQFVDVDSPAEVRALAALLNVPPPPGLKSK